MLVARRSLRNLDLPPGIVRTPDGHLRYSSPKDKRGKYVHRVVIEQLLEETPFGIKSLLPWPYEVHHQDYNKERNEPHNLLMLSEQLHAALTADRPRGVRGRFGDKKFNPKWKLAPAWVLFDVNEEVPL